MVDNAVRQEPRFQLIERALQFPKRFARDPLED
jgi:hypothetical protein